MDGCCFFHIAGIWWLHVELCLIGVFVLLSGTGELFDARRRAMSQMGPQASPWFSIPVGKRWPQWSLAILQLSAADRSAGSAGIVDAVDVREVATTPAQLIVTTWLPRTCAWWLRSTSRLA